MNTRALLVIVALLTVLAVSWWQGNVKEKGRVATPPTAEETSTVAESGRDALLPLPEVPQLPVEKVALGKRLFFEKRLSHDNTLACASCHDFTRGGTDRLRVSVGVGGAKGAVNAPTIFNASLNFVQFWDGRAASLEAQAAGPVHNPLEMASSWEEAIPKLQADGDYRAAFGRLYPQGMSGATIVDAIATYERTLLTPNSRFDRFLRGNKSALDALEQLGYRRFLDHGCASCHQGVLVGGNLFQRFGVMGDYFKDRPATQGTPADLGRFNVTGRAEDRHVFKVPSLRNVAVTTPYFHDGSAASLQEAVIVMGRYQLGRDLSGADVLAIVAFLRSLTGEWDGQFLQ